MFSRHNLNHAHLYLWSGTNLINAHLSRKPCSADEQTGLPTDSVLFRSPPPPAPRNIKLALRWAVGVVFFSLVPTLYGPCGSNNPAIQAWSTSISFVVYIHLCVYCKCGTCAATRAQSACGEWTSECGETRTSYFSVSRKRIVETGRTRGRRPPPAILTVSLRVCVCARELCTRDDAALAVQQRPLLVSHLILVPLYI